MFSKTIAIYACNCALLFKYNAVLLNLFLFTFSLDISNCSRLLVPIIREIKCLTVFSCDVSDFRPLSLVTNWPIIILEYWSNSKAICSPRHQVSDYTFVGFPFVYLSELFLPTDFDSDSILQHILQDIFLSEIGGMTPWDLNSSGCLAHQYKNSSVQGISIQFHLVIFLCRLIEMTFLKGR